MADFGLGKEMYEIIPEHSPNRNQRLLGLYQKVSKVKLKRLQSEEVQMGPSEHQ